MMWSYKRPVFGIFHMQRQLHAKESGDAHESSRIWRILGYARDLVSAMSVLPLAVRRKAG